MRLPTDKHRLERHAFALVCAAIAGICGCQGPQYDRLDGSPTAYGGGQLPMVDNAQPPAHVSANPRASQDGDAVVQSSSINDAAINEKLNAGHREAALNHYQQAEACYRSVLDLEPDNAMANHRLAILADRRGDFATSEKCYLNAIKRQPNNPDLLSDLGYSYLLQGRHAESERCLLAARRANPQHRKALDNLSLLYAKLGDRDRAFEMLKRSVGEAEARVRLAQLFPQTRAGVPDDETITASFAPFSAPHSLDHNIGTTAQATITTEGTGPRETPSTVGARSQDGTQSSPLSPRSPDVTGAAGQSPLEKQLADLMERERQRAIEVRTQEESVNTQIGPPAEPLAARGESSASSPAANPMPQQAAQLLPEPAVSPKTSLVDTAGALGGANDRIPDDRINDAFAAIDREGSDHSVAAAAPADRSGISQTTPASSWGSSSGDPRTDLAPGTQANPRASVPRAPVQSSPVPTPQSLAPASPWTGGDSVSATHLSPSDTSVPRTASDSIDWNSIATAPPTRANHDPAAIVPAATPNATSLANTPPAPSGPIATRPENADSRDSWDRDTDPSTPQWPGGNGVNPADRTPDPGPHLDRALEAQSNSPPRIVATGVVPTSGAERRPGQRVPDELDEFEAQIQKNKAQIHPGRSSSNGGSGAKPSIQSLPSEQQTAARKLAEPGDPSEAGRDPWSVRIQPRREPPPMFAPDDASMTDKKPLNQKQGSFDSGTNWSDVPPWQEAPAPRNSSADRENGPAIRPGSF